MTAMPAYGDLRAWASLVPGFDWLGAAIDRGERLLSDCRHGDLPVWRRALVALPSARFAFDGSGAAPVLGETATDRDELTLLLMLLHPWRKGPFRIGGVDIDAEWRSDLKWQRIAPHIDLSGHRVLDVGSGNGYYGWRMLAAGAERVVGVDPTLVHVMQWLAAKHFSGPAPHHVLPLGIEALPSQPACFDTVFSMGVLYHRKHPVDHLRHLAGLVRPQGQVVLETLIVEGDETRALAPSGRYARMRNVWALPTIPQLGQWLERAGLPEFEVLGTARTLPSEQRSTTWMRFESLDRGLDPENDRLTVEGLPAPVRAALLIRAPG